MIKAIKQMVKNKDIRKKLLFTIFMIFVIRVLSNIPMFGIDRTYLTQWLQSDIAGSLGLFNMISGNSFSQMSIFALGITPYITASIIIQLLGVVNPRLGELQKDGKSGQKVIEKINYIVAFLLSIFEGIMMAIQFKSAGLLMKDSVLYIGIVSISLILGSILLIGFGFILDKHGLGKGISVVLMVNILSNFFKDIYTLRHTFLTDKAFWIQMRNGAIIAFIIIALILFIIYLNESDKRIPVQYAEKISEKKEKPSYIPLKVNMANVMPVIFASSIFQFISIIFTLLKVKENSIAWNIKQMLSTSNWFKSETPIFSIGVLIYIVFIVLFAYFYISITFDPEEVAKNIQNQNATIEGVNPGLDTENYLKQSMKYLIFIGAMGLCIVMLVPMILSSFFQIGNLALGGTSIIIVISVFIETYKKVQTELKKSLTPNFFF